MATHTSAPALDLSTDTIRPFIRINQLDYDIRVVDDFTAVDMHHLERLMPRVVPLAKKLEQGTASEGECSELSALLDGLITLVLVAPADVRAKLGDINKVKVFKVFMELLPQSLVRAGVLPIEALATSRGPGTKSLAGSNGSTAGLSRRGPRKSR